MGISTLNPCPKCLPRGLTLIEVLIALSIIAIALTAIIKATAQNIRATSYLRDKSIALYVAQNTINEARVGLIDLPLADEQLNETRMVLGQTWYIAANRAPTANPHIFKINVNVYTQTEQSSPTMHLESYMAHEK